MPTKFTIEHTCPHCHEVFDVSYRHEFKRQSSPDDPCIGTLPVSSTCCPSCGNTDTQQSDYTDPFNRVD